MAESEVCQTYPDYQYIIQAVVEGLRMVLGVLAAVVLLVDKVIVMVKQVWPTRVVAGVADHQIKIVALVDQG
jgi:hypothetical protein